MTPNGKAPTSKTSLNIVLFSGGSGTKSISEFLAGQSQVSLSVLINCYDDGHSTGRLRRFVPGMLGPSDVRKNIGRLMPSGDRCYAALRALSDHRLPVGMTRKDALPIVGAIAEGKPEDLPVALGEQWDCLMVRQAHGLSSYAQAFLDYESQEAAAGRFFDYTDCALGNIYFAGCYLACARDFNATVDAFGRFYEINAALLNVTQGENLFLVAEKDDGSFFLNEADVVACPAKIRRASLIHEQEAMSLERVGKSLPIEELRERLQCAERLPDLNPQAREALEQADVIIYGPGTQHSSLLPSYLTKELGAYIAANQHADKVFIANIRRDVDIQLDDANDLADKLLEAMRRGSPGASIGWRDIVTHFFVQRQSAVSDPAYVPFDDATFRYPLDTVLARDWEAGEGRHEGGYVFSELQQIVQSRIQITLAPRPFLVSLIVPALNEEATVEQALKRLMALDFSALELGKEVILVDGGSTDRTLEVAKSVRGVRVLELKNGHGRGAALRRGVEECRGNYVVFFPADNEYNPEDLYTVVRYLREGQYHAVFGTRSTKVLDLTAHLKALYHGKRSLYLASKYGGLAISILTLLLYNRYVSDVLTNCKGFNSKTLRSLNLTADGVEMEAEIVAKLCKSLCYILEVPVDFRARSRAEGKKTRMIDGLKTAWLLLRYRYLN